MRRVLVFLAILGLMGAHFGALPLVVSATDPDLTLAASDHTYMREGNKDVTHQGVWLSWGYGVDDTNRALLEFDLDTVDGVVADATLWIYVSWVGGSWNGAETQAYWVTRTDWVGSEATWNSYKSASAWTAGGGDYGYENAVSAQVGAGNWMSWNVTGLVNRSIDLDHRYVGILILETAEVVYSVNGHSPASSDAKKPKLEISYEPVEAPTISDTGVDQIGWTSARTNVYIDDDGGEMCNARVYWGTTDQGSNYTAWDASSDEWGVNWDTGASLSQTMGIAPADALVPDTLYYYYWRVWNTGGSANVTGNFTTDAYYVCSISRLAFHSVTLSTAYVGVSVDDFGGDEGNLTLYYGTVAGSEGNGWASSVSFGTNNFGAGVDEEFWHQLTGLTAGTEYFYEWGLVNEVGAAFTTVGSFNTYAPVGVEWYGDLHAEWIEAWNASYYRYWWRGKITGDGAQELWVGYIFQERALGATTWAAVAEVRWIGTTNTTFTEGEVFWVNPERYSQEYYERVIIGDTWASVKDREWRYKLWVGHGGTFGVAMPSYYAATDWRIFNYEPEKSDIAMWWGRVEDWDFAGKYWFLLLLGIVAIYAGFRTVKWLIAVGVAVLIGLFVVMGLLESWLVVVLALVAGAVLFVLLKKPFESRGAG